MRFPLGPVLTYATRNEDILPDAFSTFFNGIDVPNEAIEQYVPLFNEWLIFDFKQRTGSTFLNEYVLRNPDNISPADLDMLTQIAQTQFYGGFELIDVKAHMWMCVEHLFAGKKYKVYDQSATAPEAPKDGVAALRIACVNRRWYVVGADSVIIGRSYTPRFKKSMHSQELFRSPIDLVRLLSAKPTPTPARMSKKSIEQKRKQLAQNYRKLAQVTRSLLIFDEVLQLIYNEDGANPLDIFEQIKTKHLSQEQHIEAMQLFNDMWNFFPHRMLNDNSPIDMVQKHLT